MSNFGLKISLPGFDAVDASPEECSVHSGYACPKIDLNADPAHYGSLVYTFVSNPAIGTTTNLLTIPHKYKYPPANIVHWKYNFGSGDKYGTLRLDLDAVGTIYFVGYADSTNFVIDFVKDPSCPADIDVSGKGIVLRYQIWAEEAA